MAVVIDPAAGDESSQIGGERVERKAGDKVRQVEGMGPDVAGRTARPGPRGIGAPVGLLLAGAFQGFGQPVLGIFDLDDPQLSELTPRDHGLGVADHRIAGVVVGEGEDHACGLGGFRQFLRLGQGGGQRLVADDMDAAFQELQGDRGMHVVRRHDGDGVDAVLAAGLFGRHFGKAGVGAGHAQIGG
jgi:hypothetical protein